MGVTISTHNGSAVAREHNIRNQKVVSKEPHIDINGKHEIWIDEPVRQAYDRLFGQALEAYNAKQSRPERQIDSYYHAVCKDKKKHPVYEMVIGVYGKDENGSPMCSEEQGKEIMQQFVENWRERNPNLELIGAYYHADEPDSEPHVHIDYVPVAHGYTRGLETQTGIVKALGEQGFEKSGKETAQIQWERRENDYLTSLCERVGLRVDHPRVEGREHIDTATFKLQTQVKRLEQANVQEQDRYAEAAIKADEAEARAADAEARAKGAEKRTTAAERKLDVVNAQYDEANKDLKKILDKKARASEIKRSIFDRDTQTYHANMLERTRAIGSEAYKNLDEAHKVRQEAVSIKAEAERKAKAVEPLYQKASAEAAAATRERQQQQQIRETMEQHIEQRAEQLADEKVKAMFGGVPSNREKRLEAFCEKLKFNDGHSALEAFEEQERLLKQRSRGMSR